MFCSDAIPCAYLQPYRSGSTAHDRCTRGWQSATACPRAAAEVRSATLYVYLPHAMPAFVVSKVARYVSCVPTSKLTPSSPCTSTSIVTTAPGVLVKCGPSREAHGG